MSNWRECGHEVSGAETECLYCRIKELESQLESTRVNSCGIWRHSAEYQSAMERRDKAETKLDAVRGFFDDWAAGRITAKTCLKVAQQALENEDE